MRTGLFGHPVAHSLSPRLHEGWMQQHGIEGRYALVDVDPGRVSDGPALLHGIEALGITGANLTVPLKHLPIGHVELEGAAQATGAVNTLVKRDGWHGLNTDVEGFRRCAPATCDTAVVLGAGGAARAVVVALRERARRVVVLNRTEDRARRVATDLGVDAGRWGDWTEVAAEADLVVCAVAGGGVPAVRALSIEACSARHWIDLNYWCADPPHQVSLRQRGVEFTTGHRMLVVQAALAFEAFHGIAASASDLEQACATLRDGGS